ncbi:lytic transglycosylase domain-containing protein [Acinetobacter sp. SwsAc6]|uniref:lytic transglycosylase domain-containing protein n=1 Tax=Acinetobacter sp. SwsAc6 TaxID=2749439 RepID=UPI0015BFEC5B|nr:lytic transglycosylase domain-containing protein [Acinetobacter sp. SwsAc6]NWK74167.1 lytic transglycosylase domain-containing protein [Acinetobacter sp. SwsAc6]
MATSSLGLLTVDLLLKLAGFEQGLDAAERKAKKGADNIKKGFAALKDQVAETFSGTQLGSIIDNFNTKLGSIRGGALVATGALAGMAVGGVVVGTAALAKMAIETAKADAQLQILANRANISTKSFQILEYAASGLGISQDQLGSIFADVQEKLGEFSATEGGGAADFFDALKNNTKMTDDQIKVFGKTLQGKDGVEAVQMLNDKMDELGATSQERRFVFESLASDLGNLAPLFAENGSLLSQYGEALEEAGVIKSKEALEQSKLLAAQTESVRMRFDGFKTQLTAQMMPALNSVIGYFIEGAGKGGQFGSVIQSVGYIAKGVGVVIIGVAASIEVLINLISGFIDQAKNVADTAVNVWDADGAKAKAQALAQGLSNGFTIAKNTFVSGAMTIQKAMDGASGVLDSSLTKLDKLSQVNLAVGNASEQSAKGIKTNTKEAEENAKAAEKQAAAKAKLNKELQVNAKVQANAAKFGFASLESQYKLPSGLLSAVNMQESRGNANAIGPSTKHGTAKGGFQLIDTTAKRFGLLGSDVFNTGKSAEAAAKYFQFLYDKFGSWEKAISAYHAGEGNVERGTGLGPINREYVKNVMGYMDSTLKGVGTTASDAVQYVDEILRSQKSVIQNYLTEREKLELDHIGKLKAINYAFAGDDSAIKKYTGLQNTAYEKGLSAHTQAQKLKDLSEKKALLEVRQKWMTAGDYAEQYYSLVREEILATSEYSPDMKNALIKQANIQQGIEQNEKRESVWSDYKSMMGLDESPYQQDMNLLKAARDEMLITEEEYQRQRLEMQLSYGAQYGADFAGMMMGLVDSSSSAYTVLGLAQKSFALYSVMMDSKVAISKAWASATFPLNMPAVGMAVMQTGLLEAAVSALSPVGFAGGGFTGFGGKYEPAGIVHKGEGVLNQEEIAALGGPAGFFALRDSIRNGFADGGLALDAPKLMNVQSPAMQDYVNQTQQNASAQLTPQHLQINNILDPSIVGDFMGTTAGTKTFINFIKNNRTSLKAILA